jgi:hypothetical protein
MPNHTANNFTITGPIADIKRFIDIAKDGDTELSFNKLVPMPDELRGISSPVRIMTQAEIDEVWATWNKQKADGTLSEYQKGGPFGLGITKETSDSYKSKYGVDNWYDWAIANYGSKWGVYDEGEWNITEDGDITSAGINYQTAWSPVTNAWERISKNYPSLEFFHEFADEGGGFVGNQLIQNGDIVEDNDYEWDSDEGIVIREAVGMWVEEDEEEVEN